MLNLSRKKSIIIILPLTILTLILALQGWKIYELSTQYGYLNSQIKEIKSQVKSESEEKLNWNGETADQTAKRINKYGATIRLMGGTGSRLIQKEAWNLEDQEYLTPEDEWVPTLLNSPADFLRSNCREGFDLISCDGGDKEDVNSNIFCARIIDKAVQNVISIECHRAK